MRHQFRFLRYATSANFSPTSIQLSESFCRASSRSRIETRCLVRLRCSTLMDSSWPGTQLDFRLPWMAVAFVWTSPRAAGRCSKVRGTSTGLSSRFDDPSKCAFSSIDNDR